MYDTVVINSPEISIEVKDKILDFCKIYEGKDIFTGELLYSFTRGELKGSFDYRIRISVADDDWVKENTLTPVRVKTYWHMQVECSLHKLLMGHNCYGGSQDIKHSIRYLINVLEKYMQVELPEWQKWEVCSIDVSDIFRFKDKSICRKIIANMKNMYYTRRKPMIFDTSLHFAGSTTTNKFYWKGPEFEKHDYKRVMKYIAREYDLSYSIDYGDRRRTELVFLKMKYDKILERAMNIIRFECSIKVRKLKELFGGVEKVYVHMLEDSKLESLKDNELRKLIKEDETVNIVRRSDLVLERLKSLHGTRLSSSLYSTWCQIVQFGQDTVRKSMFKTTYYQHVKKLEKSGVSWTCSSVQLKSYSIVPEDFSFLSAKYRDDRVDEEVIKKLAEVA